MDAGRADTSVSKRWAQPRHPALPWSNSEARHRVGAGVGSTTGIARRTAAPMGVTGSLPQIDSMTQRGYRFVTGDPAEIPLNLNLRVPVKFLSHASRQLMERQGQMLERTLANNPSRQDGQEPTGFWRAFRLTYPQAWGYAELSAVGYNPDRTRALVYSAHKCGERCLSSDAWLLARKGNKWSIAERIRREELALWYLDSLRHLGRSAKPAWYKAGRARGVFRNVATGGVFPNQEVIVHLNERDRKSTRLNSSHLVISYAVFCLKKKSNWRSGRPRH